MALGIQLWRVGNEKLEPVSLSRLNDEQRLEDWFVQDPSVLGMDIPPIGRQVPTQFSGRIDILALDREANCIVVELKRDRTPRDVVAQVLDYASCVKDLGYDDLDQICLGFRGDSLSNTFQEAFDLRIPQEVNQKHHLVVAASELDDSSERIIDYLAETGNVAINAVFFNFYQLGSQELLGRAWFKDPEQIAERGQSRKAAPWSGYWFVNVGEGKHRNWDDNREYGFISAGQHPRYSGPLTNLQVGDKIFAYLKEQGYVGYGEVTQGATPIKDFVVQPSGKPLVECPVKAPTIERVISSSSRKASGPKSPNHTYQRENRSCS